MVRKRDTEYYQAVTEFAAQQLGQEEIIVQIREGQTRYGRQTFVIYRVNICKLENLSGNDPRGKRFVDVAVNVDTRQASSAGGQWIPYEDRSVYDTD